MLTVSNLSKSFGIETVLDRISFNLNAGERLGLVGPNGSGKTTLLRILAGQEQPDAGSFRFSPGSLRLGYLPQGFEIPEGETLGGFLEKAEGDLPALTARLEELALALSSLQVKPAEPVMDTCLDDRQVFQELERDYDAVLARLEIAAQGAGRGAQILAALGLGELPPGMPVKNLSGGQKTRLALAGVLLASPQLLLLDEPTNHLDLAMLEWLEGWLTSAPLSDSTAVLLVSHDRAFLDNTVTGVLELDPATRKVRPYAGSYSAYLEQKLAERERQWQAYSDQQDEIASLKQAAGHVRANARFRRGGKADSGDKFARGFFANRSLATMRRARHLERRLERLLTDERVEKPRQTWQMKLEFGATPSSGRDVLVMEDLSVGYLGKGAGERGSRGAGENFPHSPAQFELLVLLKNLNLYVRHGARVALVGPNGAGKTTLLRTIAGLLPPLAGRVRLGANVRLGYMRQEQEDLDPYLDAFSTIQRTAPLSETEVRSFLHFFLFAGDDVFVPVGRLSFGERSRLSLACLVAQGCNLLLLDEPINHLDIPSRSRFEQALAGFDGTVLAVVHDRYFIEGFATEIWEVEGQGIKRWES